MQRLWHMFLSALLGSGAVSCPSGDPAEGRGEAGALWLQMWTALAPSLSIPLLLGQPHCPSLLVGCVALCFHTVPTALGSSRQQARVAGAGALVEQGHVHYACMCWGCTSISFPCYAAQLAPPESDLAGSKH